MRTLQRVAPAIPYLAVLIGLVGFQSGWASILLYHAGIVATLTYTRSWQLGRPVRTGREMLVLVGMVVLSFTAGLFIYWLWLLLKLVELLLSAQLSSLGLQGSQWLIFIGYYFTVNPLLEELFWRGYLGSPARGIILNDVWFAGYHVLVLLSFVRVSWIAVSFLVLLAAAWLWRQLARRHQGRGWPSRLPLTRQPMPLLSGRPICWPALFRVNH